MCDESFSLSSRSMCDTTHCCSVRFLKDLPDALLYRNTHNDTNKNQCKRTDTGNPRSILLSHSHKAYIKGLSVKDLFLIIQSGFNRYILTKQYVMPSEQHFLHLWICLHKELSPKAAALWQALTACTLLFCFPLIAQVTFFFFCRQRLTNSFVIYCALLSGQQTTYFQGPHVYQLKSHIFPFRVDKNNNKKCEGQQILW